MNVDFRATLNAIGFGIPEATIWDKLHALQPPLPPADAANIASEPLAGLSPDDLVISPTIYGERHCPDTRGSASNIHSKNISLSSVYHALCHGLVANLHAMMSSDVLHAAGIRRIVGSGTVIVKSAAIRREIEHLYDLHLVTGEQSETDAAVGAAMAMRMAHLASNGVVDH